MNVNQREPLILFACREYVVVSKPEGLISHADGRTIEPSVSAWVESAYPDVAGVGGSWVSPQGESIALNGVVHRLDRGTSGVMIIARTQEMFDALRTEFKERRVHKTYRALVHGIVDQDSGRIVAEIARTSTMPRRWVAVPRDVSHRRAAITDWQVMKRRTNDRDSQHATLLSISPHTGRTHQIRVHFSSIGHPIVGDQLYGKTDNFHERLMLHAQTLSLQINGERMTFESIQPPELC